MKTLALDSCSTSSTVSDPMTSATLDREKWAMMRQLLLRLQVEAELLTERRDGPNYASSRGLSAMVRKVAVVGYYDSVSGRIGARDVIASPDLATEFGTGTVTFVEAVNDYYRHCLL